jgi:hypothetical protein
MIKTLIINRAEISDISLDLISKWCTALNNIVIEITPINDRSRYFRSVELSTNLAITSEGIGSLMKLNLYKLHVFPLLCVTSEAYLPCGTAQLSELTITLSSRSDITFDKILTIVEPYTSTLKVLRIFGSKGTTYETSFIRDHVIPEDFVLEIPAALPNLKKLQLTHLDLSTIDTRTNFTVFYGARQSSWQVDILKQTFNTLYPNVALEIEFGY